MCWLVSVCGDRGGVSDRWGHRALAEGAASSAEEAGARSPRLRNGRPNPLLEPNALARRSRGPGGGAEREAEFAHSCSRGFGGRGVGCRAPGRGWRRAGEGGGLNVRPRPLRCPSGRENCALAAAAAPQVNGGQAPGTGVTRSRRCRSGEPGNREPEGAPFASSRGSPSQGAPPQGHRATAGRVPGVAGPIPPPSRAQVRPGPRGA